MTRRRGPELPYRLVAGVTPAAGQWLVVSAKVAGGTFAPEEARLKATFADVLNETPQIDTFVVNVPIGYPSEGIRGLRTCDIEARQLLGRRAGSIAAVPSRAVLARTEEWGDGLDAVTLALLPRYRQVADEMSPFRQRSVYEGRPELSFMQLNGDVPMTHSKGTREGVEERRALLLAKLNNIERVIETPLQKVRASQILDASVLLWTARRGFTHAARRIPIEPEWDAEGLRTEYIV